MWGHIISASESESVLEIKPLHMRIVGISTLYQHFIIMQGAI